MSTTDAPTSSENKEYTYAILQETSGEECESWLYFIRYQGNEEALQHLANQLEKVDWYILEDLSSFDLEMKYLVKEQTAKDMTKVDLNHHSPHRKFDGKLQMIDLGLKDHYRNEKKLSKVFDVLGYGQIENFIDGEDFDADDFTSVSGNEEKSLSELSDTSESDDDSEEEKDNSPKNKRKGTAPKIAIPRVAKFKQQKKRNNKRN